MSQEESSGDYSDEYDSEGFKSDEQRDNVVHPIPTETHRNTSGIVKSKELVKELIANEKPHSNASDDSLEISRLAALFAKRFSPQISSNSNNNQEDLLHFDEANGYADIAAKRISEYRKKEAIKEEKRKEIERIRRKMKQEAHDIYWKQVYRESGEVVSKNPQQRVHDYYKFMQQSKRKEEHKVREEVKLRWYKLRGGTTPRAKKEQIIDSKSSTERLKKRIVQRKKEKINVKAKEIVEKETEKYLKGSYILVSTREGSVDLSRKYKSPQYEKVPSWKPGPYLNAIECLHSKHVPRRVFMKQI